MAKYLFLNKYLKLFNVFSNWILRKIEWFYGKIWIGWYEALFGSNEAMNLKKSVLLIWWNIESIID